MTKQTDEMRRAINFEIAELYRILKTVPAHQGYWLRRRLDALVGLRDAAPISGATSPEAPGDVCTPDLAEVPPWAREIVLKHFERRAAERSEADWAILPPF